MTVAAVVDDLITLGNLAEQEDDASRRRSLDQVRDHLAERDRGAKVSEAAGILGVSVPTTRAWIEAGMLDLVEESSPIRVTVTSLAAVKVVVDQLREHRDDRYLLAEVMRILRDRAVSSGADVEAGLADLAASRMRRLDASTLDELLPSTRPKRST